MTAKTTIFETGCRKGVRACIRPECSVCRPQTTKPKFTPDDMIDWLYKTVHHLPTSDVELGMAIRDFIKEHAHVERN